MTQEISIFTPLDFSKKFNECGKENLVIEEQKNPFHAIVWTDTIEKKFKSGKRRVAIWEDCKFYIDLEEGREDPRDPLSRALKFKLVKYQGEKRGEMFSFKISSTDQMILLRDRLNLMIKKNTEYMMVCGNQDPGRLTEEEKYIVTMLKTKKELDKNEKQS